MILEILYLLFLLGTFVGAESSFSSYLVGLHGIHLGYVLGGQFDLPVEYILILK